MKLGSGQEGVVRRIGGSVEKQFYPGVLGKEKVAWFQEVLQDTMPFLPEPVWTQTAGGWQLRYSWFESEPVQAVSLAEAEEFLLFCLRAKLVCANIKRANFRRRPGGGLTFIDIGEWIVPMNVDYFRDSAARLFVIAFHGWSDNELQQRSRDLRQPGGLESLPGFTSFYHDLLHRHAQASWHDRLVPQLPRRNAPATEVTLLIKACAMDAATLDVQVRRIVHQLSMPRGFYEVLLLLDPFRGPFLRQYTPGNYNQLHQRAVRLQEEGLVDQLLVAPRGASAVAAIHDRWFGLRCEATHTAKGVPVAPQLWAFDQVETRYLLQCDADVLIGRQDLQHDYLADMLEAARGDDVLGVAFNIPHGPAAVCKPYDAPMGEYVPEVRCGLLDLHRLQACRPWPNEVQGGHLTLSWYRSLQRHQRVRGLRTLRGGDPRTFYVHPPNMWKHDQDELARVRDLVGQAQIPPVQVDQWDLVGTGADWAYERRAEPIVFLVKGRNTPLPRVRRCLASLAMQDDQDFGVVVIDDASEDESPLLIPHLLGPLREKTTLVRREAQQGRMPNFLLGIRALCTNPESLIVILDLDDALLDPSAVGRLRREYEGGADVILASMFRPDKPAKLYHPDFRDPRAHWGGEVWIHLRSFRKRLFDALPRDTFKIGDTWIGQCTDYATMIPIVELAQCPVYIPEYLYYHERTTPRTPERRVVKDEIIRRILAKPAWRP
ncbi:MAG: glycosyltransferase family 2 protein [Phycisphaeraceae bacterium]